MADAQRSKARGSGGGAPPLESSQHVGRRDEGGYEECYGRGDGRGTDAGIRGRGATCRRLVARGGLVVLDDCATRGAYAEVAGAWRLATELGLLEPDALAGACWADACYGEVLR